MIEKPLFKNKMQTNNQEPHSPQTNETKTGRTFCHPNSIGAWICLSEYAEPAWEAWALGKQVNVAENESARIISRSLSPLPASKPHPIFGITTISEEIAGDIERNKQILDPSHSLRDHQPISRRLKSRKAFWLGSHF